MTQGRFVLTQKFFCLLGALALSACMHSEPKVELHALTLDVAPRANEDTPIAVDFIAVKDPELLILLSGIPAKQWFAEREQYRRDYSKVISVWSLELVPGQFMESRDFPLAGNSAAGLLVFAGYNSPGVHRLRLGEQRTAWLKFENRDMRLLSEDEL